MAKVNFNLRKAKSEVATPINMVIRYNNLCLVYPTGLSIHPENWNNKDQKVKQSKKVPHFPEMNQRLTELSNIVLKVYNRYRNENSNHLPSISEFRELLHFALNNSLFQVKLDFFSFIENYLNELPKKQNLQTNKPLAKITIRAYKQSFTYLKEFSKLKRRRLDFNDINIDFYNEFVHFLTYERGLRINTTGKHLRNLKTFVGEAFNRGHHTNLSFKQKSFKVVSEKSDSIYLKESELIKLAALDFTSNKRLENVRDLFLIGCYTGLRFSDFTQIKLSQLIDEGDNAYFQIEMQKTGNTVNVPLHPTVKKIMKKYEGITPNSLPRSLSNQKMNEYLKEIGKMLPELHSTFTRSYLSKGQKVNMQIPKWEMLSTHTARRSFATNLYLDNFPSQTIMQLTGHKTERAFLKYLKITDRDAVKKINSFWKDQYIMKAVH